MIFLVLETRKQYMGHLFAQQVQDAILEFANKYFVFSAASLLRDFQK